MEDYQKQIEDIYRKFDPEKIPTVPALLEKYKGYEAELLKRVQEKFAISPEVPKIPPPLPIQKNVTPPPIVPVPPKITPEHQPQERNLLKDATLVIRKVKEKTEHTWVFTKFVNAVFFLLELFCYATLISMVIFAIYLPSGEFIFSVLVDKHSTISAGLTIPQLVTIFNTMKGLILFLGLMMLLPAILFRRLRKRNHILEELNSLTEKFANDFLH